MDANSFTVADVAGGFVVSGTLLGRWEARVTRGAIPVVKRFDRYVDAVRWAKSVDVGAILGGEIFVR